MYGQPYPGYTAQAAGTQAAATSAGLYASYNASGTGYPATYSTSQTCPPATYSTSQSCPPAYPDPSATVHGTSYDQYSSGQHEQSNNQSTYSNRQYPTDVIMNSLNNFMSGSNQPFHMSSASHSGNDRCSSFSRGGISSGGRAHNPASSGGIRGMKVTSVST